MVVEELSNSEAHNMRSILDLVKAGHGQLVIPSCFYYEVSFCENALLISPVNGNPYVFVKPATKFCFNYSPGNGTDKLRQRILAGVLFNRIKETSPELQASFAATLTY